jgi:hypothetical protein
MITEWCHTPVMHHIPLLSTPESSVIPTAAWTNQHARDLGAWMGSGPWTDRLGGRGLES